MVCRPARYSSVEYATPCQIDRNTIGNHARSGLEIIDVDSQSMCSAWPMAGSGVMKMYLNT